MQILAEAANDGWNIQPSGGVAELALSIAPFGLFPLVTAALVGFAYLSPAWGRPVGVEVVLTSGILFATSLVCCSVAAEVSRDQLYLDGGRPGTLAAWLLHGGVAVFLIWIGVLALKRRRVPHQE